MFIYLINLVQCKNDDSLVNKYYYIAERTFVIISVGQLKIQPLRFGIKYICILYITYIF